LKSVSIFLAVQVFYTLKTDKRESAFFNLTHDHSSNRALRTLFMWREENDISLVRNDDGVT